MATKAERDHMGAVAALGCVVCRNLGFGASPAEVHHIRAGQGRGQRSGHKKSIGLCPPHHRGTDHPRTPSIHKAKRAFESRFGTELELYERTLQELGMTEEAL